MLLRISNGKNKWSATCISPEEASVGCVVSLRLSYPEASMKVDRSGFEA